MKQSKASDRRQFLDEVALWPRPKRIAFGATVIPLLSFYVATSPTALLFGKRGEFWNFFAMSIVLVPTILGLMAHLKWPQSRVPFVAAPILLTCFLWVFVALMKPPSEWVAGLPFVFEVIGTPILANYLFWRYEARVGLKQDR
jgi:hypothetical protein